MDIEDLKEILAEEIEQTIAVIECIGGDVATSTDQLFSNSSVRSFRGRCVCENGKRYAFDLHAVSNDPDADWEIIATPMS